MEKWEPWYNIDVNVNGTAIVENSMEIPQKLKIELPSNLAISKNKTSISDICNSLFITALFTLDRCKTA